jgi:hypothetical protein
MRTIAILIGLLVASCTDTEATRQVLEDQGYTNITVGGYTAFSCGKDTTCTEFTATTPAGRHVSGAVGCGVGCGKSCTIRFDR